MNGATAGRFSGMSITKSTIPEGSAAAVIVAGGSGSRMGKGIQKQYRLLDGIPVLIRSVMAFEASPSIGLIVIVIPESDRDGLFREHCESLLTPKAGSVQSGGPTRQDSVARGLAAVDDSFDLVAIHDGVRPLVSVELIERCVAEALRLGAVVPGVPVTDAVKSVDSENRITATLSREGLWTVQTPQVFRREIIVKSCEKAFRDGYYGTDDSAVVERAGYPVTIIEGSRDNLKITYEADLARGEGILAARSGERG